jgi:anti-anti-sigma regulatory factor
VSESLDVRTGLDGSMVLQPHGNLGPERAVELRQVLVHTIRQVRPMRLILDLAHVSELDPINLSTLAAVCGIADDHQVIVFVDNPTSTIAGRLVAAGVPLQRLRHTVAG